MNFCARAANIPFTSIARLAGLHPCPATGRLTIFWRERSATIYRSHGQDKAGPAIWCQHQAEMSLHIQLEYWKDTPWFVGRLPHVPGVFSQGATLADLEENIRDAYQLMLADQDQVPVPDAVETKEIEVAV